MLLLESFYDKQNYVSPEDEIKIYYETRELLKIWKDIILTHSNDRITDLTRDKQEIISNIIPYLKNITLSDKTGIAPQLDREIVKIILWGASNFLSQKPIIDEIYKKTRSSMFQYFHHDLLVSAYLKINEIDSAIEVIKHMLQKDHTAYFFAILKYDETKFKNIKFETALLENKKLATIKLLAKGESVTLNDISFDELLQMIEKVKENI